MVLCTALELVHSCSILFAILPITHIHTVFIRIGQCALAMPHIILPFALKHVIIREDIFTISMTLALMPLAHISVGRKGRGGERGQ